MTKTNENLQNPEATGEKPAEQKPDIEQPEIPKDARNSGMLCHLLGLIGFLGPLIAWLVTKDQHEFADQQGKESLNFQLSMLIYFAISAIFCALLVGFLLILALIVLNVLFVIIAATKASEGKAYRYPIAIRFIK